MTCSNCRTLLPQGADFCMNCGARAVADEQPEGKPKRKPLSVGCIVALVLVPLLGIPIFGILAAALYPAIHQAQAQAQATAVSARGRDIYVALTATAVEREPLGLGSPWPRTTPGKPAGDPAADISEQQFRNSTEYFRTLFDEANFGTDNWDPIVRGFDYSKLAGAGVPTCANNRLQAEQNMWTVIANLRDEDDDRTPVLVTRNVDVRVIERAVNQGITASDYATRFSLDEGPNRPPFFGKMAVLIMKDGRSVTLRPQHATLGVLFGMQELDPRSRTLPPLVYLKP